MEIPTKEQLIENLKSNFGEMIDWINEQPEDHFNKEIVVGKWTIAGHLYHLIKSVKAVRKGMLMPKLGLRTMFGQCNRPERTYLEMQKKYKTTLANNTIKAPKEYEAAAGRIFDRTELTGRYEEELLAFIKALDKWTEKKLGQYVLVHPAMGKCTIREFVYFTTFHNEHHLDILRREYEEAVIE